MAPRPQILDSRPCWCGSCALRPVFRTARFGLVRCAACGTYRTDPPPILGEEATADFYSRYYVRVPGSLGTGREDPPRGSRFWNVVAQYPPVGVAAGSATDIGCGEGGLCRELVDVGWNPVQGIDISRPRIERARGRYPAIRFYDVPIAMTDIPPGSQHLIVMDNLIEHVADPLEYLRGLGGYLAPGGSLVLITPNMNSGQFRLLGRRWTPELAPHVHVFLFTGEALAHLAVRAGFRVRAQGNFQMRNYTLGELKDSYVRGGPKGLLFSLAMYAGGAWARVVRSGPMIYVIAQPEA